LLYDITRRETFESISSWLAEINNDADEHVTILLVGNKCDLTEKRQVSSEEGKAFAERNNVEFIEVSAKTTENLEKAFYSTTNKIYQKWKEGLIKIESNSDSITGGDLRRAQNAKKTEKCCN